MLSHSVELFLGQIFLCLEGEWCWHPLWTAILLVHTASSTFYRHSLNVFDFLFYHQIETALSTDNFCFLWSSTIHGDSEMCSQHRMERIFQWSCTFWKGLFSFFIFQKHLSIAIFWFDWSLLHDNQLHFIRIVFQQFTLLKVIPRDSERSNTEVFSIKYIK